MTELVGHLHSGRGVGLEMGSGSHIGCSSFFGTWDFLELSVLLGHWVLARALVLFFRDGTQEALVVGRKVSLSSTTSILFRGLLCVFLPSNTPG